VFFLFVLFFFLSDCHPSSLSDKKKRRGENTLGPGFSTNHPEDYSSFFTNLNASFFAKI